MAYTVLHHINVKYNFNSAQNEKRCSNDLFCIRFYFTISDFTAVCVLHCVAQVFPVASFGLELLLLIHTERS